MKFSKASFGSESEDIIASIVAVAVAVVAAVVVVVVTSFSSPVENKKKKRPNYSEENKIYLHLLCTENVYVFQAVFQ